MNRLENIRVGLDIDDCLADFWGAYIKRFGNPKRMEKLIELYSSPQRTMFDDYKLFIRVIIK